MFSQQLPTATAQDKAQHERDENRVVKLARNWDEIWDQIDWQRQVPEQENKRDFARARDAIIGKQASKEDEAVGNEARECPRFAATANGEQGEDDDRVEGEEHCKGNERKVGNRHRFQPIPGERQSTRRAAVYREPRSSTEGTSSIPPVPATFPRPPTNRCPVSARHSATAARRAEAGRGCLGFAASPPPCESPDPPSSRCRLRSETGAADAASRGSKHPRSPCGLRLPPTGKQAPPRHFDPRETAVDCSATCPRFIRSPLAAAEAGTRRPAPLPASSASPLTARRSGLLASR